MPCKWHVIIGCGKHVPNPFAVMAAVLCPKTKPNPRCPQNPHDRGWWIPVLEELHQSPFAPCHSWAKAKTAHDGLEQTGEIRTPYGSTGFLAAARMNSPKPVATAIIAWINRTKKSSITAFVHQILSSSSRGNRRALPRVLAGREGTKNIKGQRARWVG